VKTFSTTLFWATRRSSSMLLSTICIKGTASRNLP